MKNTLENGAVATFLVVVIVLVGAALVLLSALDAVPDPDLKLKYSDLIDALIGVGLLGIGRGLAARKR